VLWRLSVPVSLPSPSARIGADLGTSIFTALAVPSQRAPAGGRPTPVYPINPPDAKPDHSMQRTQIADQLYEELMRSSGCLLASKIADFLQ